MKGCEDFLTIILHARIVTAANKVLSEQRIGVVEDLAKEILQKFISFDPDEKVSRSDKVHLYASQLMTLLLFWHSFNDTVREGDGD